MFLHHHHLHLSCCSTLKVQFRHFVCNFVINGIITIEDIEDVVVVVDDGGTTVIVCRLLVCRVVVDADTDVVCIHIHRRSSGPRGLGEDALQKCNCNRGGMLKCFFLLTKRDMGILVLGSCVSQLR